MPILIQLPEITSLPGVSFSLPHSTLQAAGKDVGSPLYQVGRFDAKLRRLQYHLSRNPLDTSARWGLICTMQKKVFIKKHI